MKQILLLLVVSLINISIFAISIRAGIDNKNYNSALLSTDCTPEQQSIFYFNKMKQIPLTKGQFALVDDEDFDYLNHWKWTSQIGWKNNYYAARKEKDKSYYCKITGRYPKHTPRFHILIHRIIMKAEKGQIIDHIDGNGLNNQKSNLRICTHAENMRNRKIHINSTSKYLGVYRRGKKWSAQITTNYNQINLGMFKNEVDAAKAYNEMAIKYHGEFATINKI